ncbi:LysR family transcriptional regulator [Corallincola luteus]|uniref:LysR family transcriptional regulator n=1 Tax=Corallincola luteus TaxID=1775177 RepID=A0ABY2AM07_9GAMM|nr:LysR family transcriptional regulator [Corallincola luteus]TCI02593.1 LysR family transcriptional regulator [Corallincola luteus]
MINPTHLRTFLVLAETGHFTHTAEQLHMTQPGVSQHIMKLEAHLGTPLLHRFGKRFELTEAGRTLQQYAQAQMAAEQNLIEQLASDEGEQGECRLACSGAIANQLYPELLSLQQRCPALQIKLEAAPNESIIADVKENHCELGLITRAVNDPALQQETLGQDELCLVMPAGSEFSWQQLQTLGFINHPDGHHYATAALAANFPAQFIGMSEINEAGYINQLNQILLPIARGIGFTVLPASALHDFPYAGQICCASLSQPVTETVYLISKKHRPLGKRYEHIKEVIYQQWQQQ